MNLPLLNLHEGVTAARYGELHNIGPREASRRLRALGYDYRQNRWYPPGTPHKSMDSWNAAAPKGAGK